jgi:subtilisin-like proprotein convertase family protein
VSRLAAVRHRSFVVVACVIGAAGLASVAAAVASAGAPSQPAQPHLVVVPTSAKGTAALAQSAARKVAGYRAFTLVEATGADVARLVAAGGEVRDDMREVRIGTRSVDPATSRPSLRDKSRTRARQAAPRERGLAVVQYAGPLKDEWIQAVRATGVEVVSYMAQNAQLVNGDNASLSRLAALSTRQPFVRAVTPYTAADKLLPGLARAGRAEVVVSTVDGAAGAAARTALSQASTPRGAEVPIPTAGVVQQRVSLDASALAGLADRAGVVAIEPFATPRLLDERAAQIVAGNLNAGFQPLLTPNYRSVLSRLGLTHNLTTIDITDGGVDKGVVPVPAGSHPDFYAAGDPANASRIRYAHENTAADTDARDCGGHGTNVASIAAGFNSQTGAAVADAQGFHFGLGVSPYAKLGATKIFNCSGNFDVTTSITALHSSAYASGARISNNSWGADTAGGYSSTSQEFDALVRDAQPTVAGRQPLTEVVAAGNAGPRAETVGAPGTAKNVITVGASENVRPIGSTDGCAVADAGADSARDVIDFSSRGPAADLRQKPDLVAPGTHVTGAQPQTGASYDGSGTCNPQFPAGSSIYSLVSGTSQATPEASGFASLVHRFFIDTYGDGTRAPSPAMVKALMVNTAADLAGGQDGDGGTLASVPNAVDGWGRIDLANLTDGTARQVVDQSMKLTTTGNYDAFFYHVDSASKPLRVTLAYTDAPGPTTGDAFVNDLDLEVTAGGVIYKGNVFSGGRSVAGGTADPRDNVENVFLPAGVTGTVKVKVIAKNLAGDGIPGVGDTTDQDFALVTSNVGPPINTPIPLVADGNTTVTRGGDGDAYLEPGEPFTVAKQLRNVGREGAVGVTGTMTAAAGKAEVTQPDSAWPHMLPGGQAVGSPAFGATVSAGITCGDTVDLTVHISASSGDFDVPLSLRTGHAGGSRLTTSSTDVPKPIPDDDPAGVVSNATVAGPGLVGDMNVRISSLTHPFVGDLEIDLQSPAGTTVRLFNHEGFGGQDLTNTTFDDQAPTSIEDGSPPFTGSFKPFEPLSAFVGQAAAGTWKLIVRDTEPGDVGTLHSWNLSRLGFVC